MPAIFNKTREKFCCRPLASLSPWRCFLDGWHFLKTQRNEQAQVLYGIEEILEVDLEDDKATLKLIPKKEKMEAALVEIDSVIEKESGIVKQQAMIYKNPLPY